MKLTTLQVVLGIVGSIAFALLLIVWFFVEANAQINAKREALLTELPLALSDDTRVRPILEDHPLFAPPTGEDAGPLLNERLGWAAEPGDLISTECRGLLRTAGENWRQLTKEQVSGCDTRWLRDLRACGRWSLRAGFRARMAAGTRTDFAFPNFIDLQNGAKLHLIRNEDQEEAAQDVRHLARLLFTHEYLVSAMVGLALLSIEARSWELAGNAWSKPPLTDADREAVRQHLFTALFGVNPLAPQEIVESTVSGMPGFRRRLLLTEQSFARNLTALSESAGTLESARWELAHPYVTSEGDPSPALTWPAALGGAMVKRLAPERFAQLAILLNQADALPARGRWASGQSESMDRRQQR